MRFFYNLLCTLNKIESLYDRILGRTAVHDVYHPLTGDMIIGAGEELTEDFAKIIL